VFAILIAFIIEYRHSRDIDIAFLKAGPNTGKSALIRTGKRDQHSQSYPKLESF
jgi:hypothetical protein